VLYQALDQSQVIPGVIFLETDPIAGKNAVMGQPYSYGQGNAKDYD
jgi:hypothetical protein